MKLRHSILALCASTATAAPTSPADNNPLSVRALTCAQMGGSYTSASTNTKFTVTCKSTPNAAIPLSFIRTLSFDACLDACADMPLCDAAVYNSGFNDCNLYVSAAGGVRSNPAYDFAIKAAPEPEPQPTTTAEAITSEATTSEAQPTTITSSEPTTSEAITSEAANTSSEATSEVATPETSPETTSSSKSVSDSTSQATVDSSGVTSSIESTTAATTSETVTTAITSIETSVETSTILEISSTSEATTLSEQPTTSGITSLEIDTTTLEVTFTSEVATASKTSSLETSTIVTGSTTAEPVSSSTSEVPTETADCDGFSTTESALATTTLQPSEPLTTLTTLTTSASMTQDVPTGSESSSIASQLDSAVSFPCTTETQAATETSELVHNQSTSTLAGASSSAGSKTVPDYGLPVTATSQYALPTSKVITVTEGGYVITKTVPCDTPSGTKGYPAGQGYSGSSNDYQTRTGHGADVEVQPMTGPHNYLPPSHEGGGAYASIDNHQTRTGHHGYADAQPTAGSHTNVHSQYLNDFPTGTGHNVHVVGQPTHGASLPDYKDGHSYVPAPSQGQRNKPQPGHEADQTHHEDDQPDYENAHPSIPIHGTPQGNNNGEPYPTQDHVAQPTTAASKPGNPSPVIQGHEAASTTLATKAGVTNEAEAPKATHGGDSSKAGDEPVAISGANRYQIMAWTWVAMVMALVFI